MTDTTYTPEFFTQTGRIYDRLEQLPLDKRPLVKAVMDAFINGMQTQERLIAERALAAANPQQAGERESA